MTPTKDFYTYKARVLKISDGDTFHCYVDLGFRLYAKVTIRVAGFDAPETRKPANPEEIERGKAAKARARDLLLGREVILHSEREGVYNRWEGRLTLPSGRDFAEIMKEEGYSK